MTSKIKVDQIENTNGASDVAFTGTGGISLSSVKLSTIKSSNGTAAINVNSSGLVSLPNSQQSAQSFRLNQDVAGTGTGPQMLTDFDELTSDYERVGSANWTVNAGAFSVATNGTYLCMFTVNADVPSGGSPTDEFDAAIQLSTNSGGSYTSRAQIYYFMAAGTNNASSNQFIFTVANTSTFRLRFILGEENSLATGSKLLGHSSMMKTGITFVKLGVI